MLVLAPCKYSMLASATAHWHLALNGSWCQAVKREHITNMCHTTTQIARCMQLGWGGWTPRSAWCSGSLGAVGTQTAACHAALSRQAPSPAFSPISSLWSPAVARQAGRPGSHRAWVDWTGVSWVCVCMCWQLQLHAVLLRCPAKRPWLSYTSRFGDIALGSRHKNCSNSSNLAPHGWLKSMSRQQLHGTQWDAVGQTCPIASSLAQVLHILMCEEGRRC